MLESSYYPNVDLSFMESRLDACERLIPGSKQKVGRTTMYVKQGNQQMFKRLILLREIEDNQISYYQATAYAIQFGFLSELMDWLKINKGWVEGEYSLTANQN